MARWHDEALASSDFAATQLRKAPREQSKGQGHATKQRPHEIEISKNSDVEVKPASQRN